LIAATVVGDPLTWVGFCDVRRKLCTRPAGIDLMDQVTPNDL
jgi:hypothetical protein